MNRAIKIISLKSIILGEFSRQSGTGYTTLKYKNTYV